MPARRLPHWVAGFLIALFTALPVFIGTVVADWARGTGQTPAQAPSSPAVPGLVRVPITGSAAVLNDGRMIVYSVHDTHMSPDSQTCGLPGLTAAEASDSVTLTLTLLSGQGCTGPAPQTPATPLPAADVVDRFLGNGGIESAPPLTVLLIDPLGSRRVVDAVTGRTIPVFDEGAGLQMPREDDWDTMSLPLDSFSTDPPFFGGPGAAILVVAFTGSGRDQNRLLMLVQVARGGWHPPPGTVTRPVMIRGHRGLAATGIIVWPEGGHTIALVGLGPFGDNSGQLGRAPFPFAELSSLAAALQAPRTREGQA